MEQHIIAHGRHGFKMTIEKEYMEYVINQRIKALYGRIKLVQDGEPGDGDSIEDLENKIEALTNALNMI